MREGEAMSEIKFNAADVEALRDMQLNLTPTPTSPRDVEDDEEADLRHCLSNGVCKSVV